MEFTARWFDRDTLPLWQKHIVPRGPIRSYLEIGVHEGRSLLWVAEHLLSAGGHAVGVDPYLPKRPKNIDEVAAFRARCEANLAEFNAQHPSRHVTLHAVCSREFLVAECLSWWRAQDEQALYDFIYIDGEHWAHAAIVDLCLAWQVLRPGGVLAVDDVHRAWHRAKPLVRAAVDSFERCFETQYAELFRASRQRGYVKL